MEDRFKLYEITPLMVSYVMHMREDHFDFPSTDSVEVILKDIHSSSLSAMELTMRLVPAFGNCTTATLEKSAMFVYHLCTSIMVAEAKLESELDISHLIEANCKYSKYSSRQFLENLMKSGVFDFCAQGSEDALKSDSNNLSPVIKGSKCDSFEITFRT